LFRQQKKTGAKIQKTERFLGVGLFGDAADGEARVAETIVADNVSTKEI
jgi:hypothetical protein